MHPLNGAWWPIVVQSETHEYLLHILWWNVLNMITIWSGIRQTVAQQPKTKLFMNCLYVLQQIPGHNWQSIHRRIPLYSLPTSHTTEEVISHYWRCHLTLQKRSFHTTEDVIPHYWKGHPTLLKRSSHTTEMVTLTTEEVMSHYCRGYPTLLKRSSQTTEESSHSTHLLYLCEWISEVWPSLEWRHDPLRISLFQGWGTWLIVWLREIILSLIS